MAGTHHRTEDAEQVQHQPFWSANLLLGITEGTCCHLKTHYFYFAERTKSQIMSHSPVLRHLCWLMCCESGRIKACPSVAGSPATMLAKRACLCEDCCALGGGAGHRRSSGKGCLPCLGSLVRSENLGRLHRAALLVLVVTKLIHQTLHRDRSSDPTTAR